MRKTKKRAPLFAAALLHVIHEPEAEEFLAREAQSFVKETARYVFRLCFGPVPAPDAA